MCLFLFTYIFFFSALWDLLYSFTKHPSSSPVLNQIMLNCLWSQFCCILFVKSYPICLVLDYIAFLVGLWISACWFIASLLVWCLLSWFITPGFLPCLWLSVSWRNCPFLPWLDLPFCLELFSHIFPLLKFCVTVVTMNDWKKVTLYNMVPFVNMS